MSQEAHLVRTCIDKVKDALVIIEPGYFNVVTRYNKDGIVRERVFCYELYHQIRSQEPKISLSLHGEIDKRGHPDFSAENQKNPDFVFHLPGNHKSNTLVIEVKGNLDFRLDEGKFLGIPKDFSTLSKFVNDQNYTAGLFVLYNHSYEELKSTASANIHVLAEIQRLARLDSAKSIYILCISSAGHPVEEYTLADFRPSSLMATGTLNAVAHRARKLP